MSSFENQSFDGKENLDIKNEQIQETDTLQEMSDFFEYHFIETEIFQNSYDAFSQNQKIFIEKSFQTLHKEHQDIFLDVLLTTDGLPYDEQSFIIFQEEVSNLLKELGIDKSSWNINKTQVEEIEEENNNNKEAEDSIEDKSNQKIDISKENFNKYEQINSLGKHIQDKYGLLEIDGKTINELYLGLSQDNESVDNFNVHLEFIKLYGAKLLQEVANNGTKEEFNELKNQLVNIQKVYEFTIDGFDPKSTWESYKNSDNIISNNSRNVEENVIQHGLDTSDFHITETQGSALIYGDQKIDFGEKPPVKYITNGDFELKSGELDYKVDKQLRSDIFVLEHKIPQFDEKISGLESKKLQLQAYTHDIKNATHFSNEMLYFIFKNIDKDVGNPLRNQIKNTAENYTPENTEDLKSLLVENNKNKEEEIDILLTDLNTQKNLAELKLDMMKNKLDAMREAFREQVLEKDEKVRKILEFLGSIGMNLVDQSIIQSVLDQLNSNNAMRNALGFNSEFNLENGELGYTDPMDNDLLGMKEKIKFAELFNRMISGEPGRPVDISNIRDNSGIPVGNISEFDSILLQSGIKDSGTGIMIAMSNIEKSLTHVNK